MYLVSNENANKLPDSDLLVNSLGSRLDDMEKRIDNKFSADLRNTRIVIEEQVENAMMRLERIITQTSDVEQTRIGRFPTKFQSK